MRPLLFLKFALLPVVLSAGLAQAAPAPKLRQTIKDWAVFTTKSGGDTLCYVRSFAQDKAPKNVDHGDVIFFVSIWKSNRSERQPSMMTGYTLKATPPPKARVGSTRITMYADGDEAFIEELRDEKKLIAAMKKGSLLRVEARSKRGTATTYEFSLSGITAALQKADALCK
jgi:Invasion associated locus B (IalB) protein